jgi:dolichol-phosphate mannosyltransferase
MFRGIMAATGEIVGLMDGDGQTDPTDYAAMVEALRREKVDVVIGYRATREDTWNKRWASKFANAIRKAVLHDGARDTGCPMKIFRREARAALVAFNGMHRFMPALFRGAGFTLFPDAGHAPAAREGCIEIHELGARMGGPVRPFRRALAALSAGWCFATALNGG